MTVYARVLVPVDGGQRSARGSEAQRNGRYLGRLCGW